MSESIDVPLNALRAAVRAKWADQNFRNPNSSVDVAILQHLFGLSSDANGIMNHRTRERILAFLDGRWVFRFGDSIPPDEIFDPMALMSGHLAVRLGTERDIEVALLQAVLGLPLTGLLGPVTKGAAVDYIKKTWSMPDPCPDD